jgi:hypothetical protein
VDEEVSNVKPMDCKGRLVRISHRGVLSCSLEEVVKAKRDILAIEASSSVGVNVHVSDDKGDREQIMIVKCCENAIDELRQPGH